MQVILIVDDDPRIRFVLEQWFRFWGYDVLAACNGSEALSQVASEARRIDLVVSDVNMPVMKGDEAILRIRDARPDIGVICMTASDNVDLPAAVRRVSKPFRLVDMLESVRQELRTGEIC